MVLVALEPSKIEQYSISIFISKMSKIIDIKYVIGVPEILKGPGIHFHGKKIENMILEKQIQNLFKEGWELYGDFKELKNEIYVYIQTMVKYQQKVSCEHCGKTFDSHDIMASSHLVDSADNSKKVCPTTLPLF